MFFFLDLSHPCADITLSFACLHQRQADLVPPLVDAQGIKQRAVELRAVFLRTALVDVNAVFRG